MLTDLQNFLTNQTTVTDIVGSQIWLFHLPSPAIYPAVTLHVISTTQGHNLDGRDSYVKSRIQVDSWSNSYAQATALADAIGDLIDGFTGVMGSTTFGAILSPDEDGAENHFYEQPADGGNFGLYHIASDYFCFYFE